jgi:hypothetical protein
MKEGHLQEVPPALLLLPPDLLLVAAGLYPHSWLLGQARHVSVSRESRTSMLPLTKSSFVEDSVSFSLPVVLGALSELEESELEEPELEDFSGAGGGGVITGSQTLAFPWKRERTRTFIFSFCVIIRTRWSGDRFNERDTLAFPRKGERFPCTFPLALSIQSNHLLLLNHHNRLWWQTFLPGYRSNGSGQALFSQC